MEYAILATLWNGPATMPEIAAAVYERLGQPASPALVDSHLRMLERVGFVKRTGTSSPYVLAESGSIYLADVAA